MKVDSKKLLKLINENKVQIIKEIRNSLLSSIGCEDHGFVRKNVLYITENGDLKWFGQEDSSQLPESIFHSRAEVLFMHDVNALGCYGCSNYECDCPEFDSKPQYPDVEIDMEIKKLIEQGINYNLKEVDLVGILKI